MKWPGEILYKVGDILISTSSTNPGTAWTGTTWTAFGAGRVLVGLDAGQAEFDTVEETGGAKTHTLTTAEMPAHDHGLDFNSGGTGTGSTAIGAAHDCTPVVSNNAGPMSNTGGGGAHNNLQPYITVYFWKRTA